MRYVIMADGRESRWNGYQGIHKWQIVIEGENLLERSSRLIHHLDPGAEILITSHDQSLCIPGASRHEPQNNHLEIDRFTRELIEEDTCFLYGDVFYTEKALRTIAATRAERNLFFGNKKKIFAVKIGDAAAFLMHIDFVRERYLKHEISECIGWEVYHSLQNLPLETRVIGGDFVVIDDETRDFNTPLDLETYRGIRNDKEEKDGRQTDRYI